MDAIVYNQQGKESGKINLPGEVFGLKWNADLVHQVVHSMMTNQRHPVAHTKTRGDVRGGGKKPWRQKGTGRARHGSIRSPLWVGGGVTHGPRKDKNFLRKINKKMKAKALAAILSKKLKDGEILFLDSLALSEAKTKLAKEVLSSLSKISGFEKISVKKKNAALITTQLKRDDLWGAFRNFGNITLSEIRNINPIDVLRYKYLVISNPEESIKFIKDKVSSK